MSQSALAKNLGSNVRTNETYPWGRAAESSHFSGTEKKPFFLKGDHWTHLGDAGGDQGREV